MTFCVGFLCFMFPLMCFAWAPKGFRCTIFIYLWISMCLVCFLVLTDSLTQVHVGHHTVHWYHQTGQDKSFSKELQVGMGWVFSSSHMWTNNCRLSPNALWEQQSVLGCLVCQSFLNMNNAFDRIRGICVKVGANFSTKIPISPRMWPFWCF